MTGAASSYLHGRRLWTHHLRAGRYNRAGVGPSGEFFPRMLDRYHGKHIYTGNVYLDVALKDLKAEGEG